MRGDSCLSVNKSGVTFFKNCQSGFTLLEMAVVMVVLGLLIGGSLIPLSIQMEKKDRDSTGRQLEDMREALIGFALSNGRLPCPDVDGDGVGDGAVTCSNAEGDFPWVDMGLGQIDAWGQAFTYRVSSNFADASDGTGCSASTPGISFSLCSTGNITVLDGAGGNPVALLLPAIVISHGKNWATTSSADEAENTDGDSVFIDRIYSSNSASTFDDLLIWVPPHVLKSKMVSAALLP